jgi:uncharacterized membrane protein
MRKRRILFIVLGWLFLFLQLVNYLPKNNDPNLVFKGANIPYIIGYNFYLILVIIFFLLANRLKHKILQQKQKEQMDSFLVEAEN